MHAVFIPYGMKQHVDYFLEELVHVKLTLRAYKEGEKDVHIPIQCQVRQMPFGIYEFVFPKEHADAVLTTLDFHKPSYYGIDKDVKIMGLKINPLKKAKEFLRIEEAPKFSTERSLPVLREFVSLIPLGVRYDGELTEPNGWTHEAI